MQEVIAPSILTDERGSHPNHATHARNDRFCPYVSAVASSAFVAFVLFLLSLRTLRALRWTEATLDVFCIAAVGIVTARRRTARIGSSSRGSGRLDAMEYGCYCSSKTFLVLILLVGCLLSASVARESSAVTVNH